MKYLKIAVTPGMERLVPPDWESVALAPTLNPAELATIVVTDAASAAMAQRLVEQSGLSVPVVRVDAAAQPATVQQQIADAAAEYVHQNVPGFLRDLVAFADQRPVSFTTPGHHNGQYYGLHPAGVVFNRFFGNNMLYADTSDTVAELGDTMTHAGTPLEAEQKTAAVYHADKAYFVPNGTTGSNDICVSAVVRPGDLVLFDRNNHKSLYNGALVMNGAQPVYVPTDRNAHGLIGGMDPAMLTQEKLRAAAAQVDPQRAKQPRPFRMAAVQLETYDGVFANAQWLLDRIGQLCDYVLFDCAWGGYEQFVDVLADLTPLTRTFGPEDPGILVTQSLHKQQLGMGQASQILKKDAHIKGQKRYVDHLHFNNAYLKYVTSSYNYPLYASMTVNPYVAGSSANHGWWQAVMQRGIAARKRLLRESTLFKPLVPSTIDGQPWEQVPDDRLLHDPQCWELTPAGQSWHGFKKVAGGQARLDPLKLTITTPGIDEATQTYTSSGIAGDIVAEYLTEHGILKAKADLNSLLFLLTPGDTTADLDQLVDALLAFERLYNEDAPLEEVLPRLTARYPQRYAGYSLRQLCDEMHAYYRAHQTFSLQQQLFSKDKMQEYTQTPAQADLEFRRNHDELVDLDQVVGRIAAEGALPYPPGVFIVAPGERWRPVDQQYFQVLVGAMERFAGFVPEIQGVHYQERPDGHITVKCAVLTEEETLPNSDD